MPADPTSFTPLEERFLDGLPHRITGGLYTALGDLVKNLCEFADWDFGQVWFSDAAETSLQPAAFWMRRPEMQPYRDASVHAETKYGIGILWGAYLNRRPVVCLDLAGEPTFRRTTGAAAAGLRGGIFVPVLDGPETRGVLEFLVCRPKPMDAGRATFAMIAGARVAEACR
jgi:hypothetical protein